LSGQWGPLYITIKRDATLAGQGNEIIMATLSGQIAPDVGAQLITALSNQGKLIEFQEMVERLARIEKQLESRE
jgi:hypothetical protein